MTNNNIEFQAFPKVPRLNRDIVITEKIDGTNAAVVIQRIEAEGGLTPAVLAEQLADGAGVEDWKLVSLPEGDHFIVLAQSRKRFIWPARDNYGFAAWVYENAHGLVEVLGEGVHFGEWWGKGIQKRYPSVEGRYFSLFNTGRWGGVLASSRDTTDVPGLRHVPVLHEGAYSQRVIDSALDELRTFGSNAANDPAEGIMIYHTASNQVFKVTLEGDEAPKGAAGHARDEEKV